MAINTFSALKTSIADWLNRADLTSQIPDFITLAEASFNRTLRNRNMVVRADAAIDTQYTTAPTDFLAIRTFYLKTSPITRLEFITNEQMELLKQQGFTASGQPEYLTVVGTTFETLPSPDQSYTGELIYYAKISSLSDTNTTNWLLTSHPDIYLYGALLQSAPYLRDDDRVAVWSSLYKQAVSELDSANERAETSGGVLKARVRAY